MANEYLDRQDILLETLQDAEKLVGAIQPEMKLTEVVAARMATALQMIYMAARRHPDWPKPEPAPTADSLKIDPFVRPPAAVAKMQAEEEPF